jgi:[ribosomal protein S18]-alanine N-acetyltransferase
VRLRPFDPAEAALVASWAVSADEVRAWCSRPEERVPAEVVASWSAQDDVEALVLEGAGGAAVGYGELWFDDGEAELAHLIVDPAHRGRGAGRRLAALLAGHARRARPGVSTVALRVVPQNTAALRAYAGAGFLTVDEATRTLWNTGQPADYVWMVHP